jgi:3-deoxy-D-arabino-heptulosonate 7-phosphate (DAHP) synthase
MATTYKVRYKNHCTPQEQIASGGRYYLDSDCGRKLTGVCDTSASITTTGTYDETLAVTDSASSALTSSHDFIFMKNTGSNDVLMTLDNSNYYIVLSEGEAFTSEIHASAVVKVKCGSGETSTVEFFVSR